MQGPQACQKLPCSTGICLRGKEAGASLPQPKGGQNQMDSPVLLHFSLSLFMGQVPPCS